MLNALFDGPIIMLITCNLCMINAFYPRKTEGKVSWPTRILGAVFAVAVIWMLDHFLVDASNASTSIQPPMCLLAVWLYTMLVLRMKGSKGIYCSVWAYLISEVLAQAFFPLVMMIQLENSWLCGSTRLIVMLMMTVGSAVLVRILLLRFLLHDGDYLVNRRKIIFSLMLILLHMVMTNYQLVFWMMGSAEGNSGIMVVTFRVVIGLFAAVLMYLQNDIEKRQQTQQELELMNQVWHRQQEHLRLSRENIEIINRKCHDLKHQIAALRTLKDREQIDRQIAEMENAVMIYDSVIRTGNPVLDVVLTEKSLYCEAHQINMTCLVDGKLLRSVDSVDLYTLFGNALDNAIESVMQQTDKLKRVIQVAAYEEHGMLLIRFRNYCDHAPVLVDGLPITTKEDSDYHGFGLKSIRHTAEKYGGGISIQTGSNFFSLQILLPMNLQA